MGRWLLQELVAPSGDSAQAEKARQRLEKIEHKGLYGSLSRGIADLAHGKLRQAGEAYLDTIAAARISSDPRAPAIAWYATNHLLTLRSRVPSLAPLAKNLVAESLARPEHLGFRARSELVNWWTQQAYEDTEAGVADAAALAHGCVRAVRLAGPFGHNVPADRRRSFAAEEPGPWPAVWPVDPERHAPPRVLRTERHGCVVQSSEPAVEGVYYAETYVDVPQEAEVILAVQGAFTLFVDDHPVLDRDTRHFGVWTKFGTHLRLAAGRHRVLARVAGPETSVRFMRPDGTPLSWTSSEDPRPPYHLQAPAILADPNVLSPWVDQGVDGARGEDPLALYLAAFLAHIEEQDDLAAVLLEPLVADNQKATGPVLALSATITERDPIFPDTDRRDLLRDLRTRAVAKDPELYWPRFWLALEIAEKGNPPEAVGELRKLAEHFTEPPEILMGVTQLYQQLGWKAERSRVLQTLAERFPKDPAILEQALLVEEQQGNFARADALAQRILTLNPDAEVAVERALARQDYPSAIAELKRLGKRRPDRKDIADRIAEVLTRSGDVGDTLARLERALGKTPLDSQLRLQVADARFARGDGQAIRRAIVDAIVAGGDAAELSNALDLVEGTTELSPYRLDGRKVIAAYEASKSEMEGNAARVLDYAAVWIHPDGSSRMLEHELIRIQSQEAIGKMAEQKVPEGLMLRMRVIKKNGQILEPEFVSGKPTLTMPHLEIGDYIETESVVRNAGDGQLGKRYVGPHWFFREENIAYWRSEFIVIAPRDKKIVFETRGYVPAPVVEEKGPLSIHRYRVDKSLASPDEPMSPPIQEFLPSVRVGWGVELPKHLARLAEVATDELSRDPRLMRIGLRVAGPKGQVAEGERARRLYHWVLGNIENGKEGDGRRVVIGKSGNLTSAFVYLCRILDIPVEFGVIRDKLSAPNAGPISESESFNDFAIRLSHEHPQWLTVRDKYAPFGYLPPELRGQLAYRLVPGLPSETTPRSGTIDGVLYEGTADLRADGSAVLSLSQTFLGRVAMGLRAGIEQLPQARLKDAVEGKLLARALPGARVLQLEVLHQGDLDQPVTLKTQLEVPAFARVRGHQLVISPPFAIRLTQLTGVSARETPLLLSEATYAKIHVTVRLPAGARIVGGVSRGAVKDGERKVTVSDQDLGGQLLIERLIDVPSGRVEPQAYPSFQEFTRRADELTVRDVVVSLP